MSKNLATIENVINEFKLPTRSNSDKIEGIYIYI